MADIILVEDEEVLRRSLTQTLEMKGHDVRPAESAERGLALVQQGPPDLLITDHRLPGMSGFDLLQRLKEDHAGVGVIVITAHGTIEDAVAAMREGAADYLRKPIDLEELCVVVERCLRREGLQRELDYYRSRDLSDRGTDGIIGSSRSIDRLRSIVRRVASLEKKGGGGPTLLLTGETGTGKGLTARAIHQASGHAGAPFIEVNCTAIPESLLEAELMGYEKGAFTGASVAKPGLFEAAEGGTIFFDEIGHMAKFLQAKLLKIIDEKSVRRLGSTRNRVMHCTVITATHMELEKEVAEGRFLEDLFHRINVVAIEIPPLRERENDVLLLADHFIRTHSSEYGMEPPRLSESAATAIQGYAWPGNVRQLSHAIERAIVMSPSDVIDVADLALGTVRRISGSRKEGFNLAEMDFSAGPVSLEEVEVDLIKQAMRFTKGNQVRAARLLGLSRDALRYRLEKHGLR